MFIIPIYLFSEIFPVHQGPFTSLAATDSERHMQESDRLVTQQRSLTTAYALQRKLIVRYDTIRDAILACARKPTRVTLIYRTETTANKWKTEKLKSKNGYA